MSEFQVQHLPPPSTEQTAQTMRQLAHRGKTQLSVRHLATAITQYIADKDYKSESLAVYHWVKKHIRYRKDPHNVEMVQDPETTLKVRSGDCDDMSVLIGALLLSLGHQVRFTTVGFKRGHQHSHVLAEVKLGHKAIVLDPVAGAKTAEMLGRVRTATFFNL